MPSIRPYDPARDAALCLDIWRAASEVGHPFLDRATLDADALLVRDVYLPRAEVHVAERGGEVVGFIALLDDLIGGLFVAPEHHRAGIGRALIDHAASLRDSLEVEVYEANARAHGFYLACGFTPVGRREVDDHDRPLPLIRLRRI